MEQLVEQAKGGNTIAMWALWEAVERLVKWYANRIHLPPGCGATFEDLVQSGYLALVDAVQGFDLSAGATFTGYLALHLKNAFAQCAGYRKKPDPLQSAASLDAPIPGAEDLRLSDTIPDAVDPYKDTEREIWVQQLHAALEQAISSLDPQEQSTLHARFYDGLSLKEMRSGKDVPRSGCGSGKPKQSAACGIQSGLGYSVTFWRMQRRTFPMWASSHSPAPTQAPRRPPYSSGKRSRSGHIPP